MSMAPPQPGMTSAGPPPPERRTTTAVIAISVLILLAAAAVASLLVVDRGNAREDAGSPEDVVRDYFVAADNDDCEAMLDMVADVRLRYSGAGSRAEALVMCQNAAESFTDPIEVVSTDVVEADEEDDYAIVSVELEIDGESDEREVFVSLEHGEWKLYDSEVFDEA
ncbi:MAG TPA: hypothetical protein VH479_21630 [Acidimicrobiales bacterium]